MSLYLLPPCWIHNYLPAPVDATLLQGLRNFLGSTYGGAGILPNLIINFIGYSPIPAQTGGSSTVTLDTTQMPSHDHDALTGTQSANHRHVMPGDDQLSFATAGAGWEGASAGTFDYDALSRLGVSGAQYWYTSGVDVDHRHGIGAAGGGLSHENLPPYVGMLPVIKY